MTFGTAIRICFGKYLHLSGRAGRAEYWWFFLFTILVGFAAQIIDGLIFGFADEADPGRHPVTMIVSFITFFPAFSAGWRRMHDTGKPGWFVLLPLIVVLITLAAIMIGMVGFGMIEALGADPETLRGPGAVLGAGGLTLAAIFVLVAAILKLWWLTRPGDPGPNQFGPPPLSTEVTTPS